MIKFVLKKEDLIHRELPFGLQVTNTTTPIVIQQCISLFNSEIVWDKMFTLEDAIERIESGEKMFVGHYYGEIFGHCWVEKLTNNDFIIYNVFSKKDPFPRDYGATDFLYHIIKYHTQGFIYADVDEWNDKSIRVFEKLGFTTY